MLSESELIYERQKLYMLMQAGASGVELARLCPSGTAQANLGPQVGEAFSRASHAYPCAIPQSIPQT
jgi:hypothetical protein